MATRRYSVNPGDRLIDVVEAVGAATVTKMCEFTVDLVQLEAIYPGATGKAEVIKLLQENICNWILQGGYGGQGIWPPA